MEILIILIVMVFGFYTLNQENKKRKRSELSVELLNPKYEYILTFITKDGVIRKLKVFSDCKHESSEILNFYINKNLNGIELKENDKWSLIPLTEIKGYEVKEIIKDKII
ncbi:hypothetical protein [Clostridium perfringens]|uniref:hypothetical protein n=1 Tax=Clostridium perfringens TaxID=1502 RepID=UPI000D70A751|nr:hypothetical protein [Clostridium perfringens]MBO3424431.1 hypothetical protein [Clostridium perfringens]PWX10389.1 hypothetical protein CYK69_14820 [Clostridium perfringens]PWX37285.1 hypothetical protein CYK94_08145 [Clostridium perfringens]PWX59098.1 hypothetical protein CYK88_07970 [Clostridium perfringens]